MHSCRRPAESCTGTWARLPLWFAKKGRTGGFDGFYKRMGPELVDGTSQRKMGLRLPAESVKITYQPPGKEPMSTRAVQDRFQCPRDFLKFRPIGDCPSKEGFFQFGPGTVCYGRSSSDTSQSPAVGSLHDALQDIVVMNEEVGLPFDPDEVIDNLRLEHYLHSPRIGYERALKKIY